MALSEESEEETVLHTFDEAGSYNVTLTITDTDDQTASDSVEIQVEEVPEVDQIDDTENNTRAANNTRQ